MRRLALTLVLMVAVAVGRLLIPEDGASVDTTAAAVGDDDGARRLADAFDKQLNDEWLSARARVTRLLSDDNEGSRHQRFLIETSRGQSLLVAHNIDLAPRVPVAVGDKIGFKGVYEWNDRGGVIHWTHHDPQGREPGGYIDHQRKRYE